MNRKQFLIALSGVGTAYLAGVCVQRSDPDVGKAEIDNDPRYDGYRRDFLSRLQLNPRRRALANNSASDACAFTVFEYSMMAVQMPPLAEECRESRQQRAANVTTLLKSPCKDFGKTSGPRRSDSP